MGGSVQDNLRHYSILYNNYLDTECVRAAVHIHDCGIRIGAMAVYIATCSNCDRILLTYIQCI